jgi:4-amino-4-deoxy-L-arabinose transferase-like glycosyltransferase
MQKDNQLYWLITIALFLGIILPFLIQDGMFMDAVLYSSVSHNLALGNGSFWFPKFSETWEIAKVHSFHEHPPLVFAIQSLFFKLMGSSRYVERFYVLITAIVTLVFIVLFWNKQSSKDKEMQSLSWFPVFLWILIPIVQWTFKNNMHENTMGIFDLAALFFILKGISSIKNKWIYFSTSGIFIFLASLSKGVPGIFPMAAVVIYYLVYKNISLKQTIIYTGILMLIPIIIYTILLQNDQAFESLSFYLNKRLLLRIENHPTTYNRFNTLIGIVSHLAPVIILSSILIFLFRKNTGKINIPPANFKHFTFFSLIGLSASLPMMLTMIQKNFYFSHSMPYFALAFAYLSANGLKNLQQKYPLKLWIKKWLMAAITVLFASIFVLSYLNRNEFSRDKDKLHDIYLICQIIPKASIISVKKYFYDWSTETYMNRYFQHSLDKGNMSNNYILWLKTDEELNLPYYEKIDLSTKKFDLYKRKK